MTDVIIKKINETYMKLTCSEKHVELDLSDKFSFRIPKYKHDPKVKAGKWDGIIRLYNRVDKRMYVGLFSELIKFLKQRGYSYEFDKKLVSFGNISLEDISTITKEVIKPVDCNKTPIEPYDYQYSAVHWMLNTNRSISLAATSAGKSLCIYLAVRLYQLAEGIDRIIIIVPSKMLVEQLYNDFAEYSNNDTGLWNVAVHCQKVNSDYTKQITKQVVITTWQSLKNISGYVINEASAIFVDEVHTANGPVLTKLLEGAVNVPIRHGLTGTLDGVEVHELAIQGLFGPIKRIVTAKELIDTKRATPIKITVAVFDYDNETKLNYHKQMKLVKTGRYNEELKFINSLKSRFDTIQKVISGLKGNTIVLFDRVDDYGIPLYEEYKKTHENVYLITGSVSSIEREAIKLELEDNSNAVVFATSSILSTGVSIKNLHNIVTVFSTKSKIRILQSIGRLMRLHTSKKVANFIDIVDKLDHNKIPNITLNHLEDRVNQYVSEGHKLAFTKLNLKEPIDSDKR